MQHKPRAYYKEVKTNQGTFWVVRFRVSMFFGLIKFHVYKRGHSVIGPGLWVDNHIIFYSTKNAAKEMAEYINAQDEKPKIKIL